MELAAMKSQGSSGWALTSRDLCPYKEETRTQTPTGREAMGRRRQRWGEEPTSQGTPRISSKLPETRGEAWVVSPRAPMRRQPCGPLASDSGLLARGAHFRWVSPQHGALGSHSPWRVEHSQQLSWEQDVMGARIHLGGDPVGPPGQAVPQPHSRLLCPPW